VDINQSVHGLPVTTLPLQPTGRVLSAPIDWIKYLISHLVLPLAMDKHNRVAYDSPTAGGSMNAKGGDGHDEPPRKIFIPNTLARWPWPRRLNQYYPEVKAESIAWVASLKAFSPKAQYAFDRCDFGNTWRMIVLSTCSHLCQSFLLV